MAYFRNNETGRNDEDYSRTFLNRSRQEEGLFTEEERYDPDEYDGYDDGFDELAEENAEAEWLPEENRERQKSRIRLLYGAGDLGGLIGGILVILVLMTLLISMLSFLEKDLSSSFMLFRIKF